MERKHRLILVALLLILQQVSGQFQPNNFPAFSFFPSQQFASLPFGGQQQFGQQQPTQQAQGQQPFTQQQQPIQQAPTQQPPVQTQPCQCKDPSVAKNQDAITGLRQEVQNLKDAIQRILSANSQTNAAVQQLRKSLGLSLNKIDALEKDNKDLRSTVQNLNQQLKQVISSQTRPQPQPQPQPPQIQQPPQINQNVVQSFVSNSRILGSQNEGQTLLRFFTRTVRSARLLYRASENQFSAVKFHQRCDGIKDTLTIMETEFGKKLGGYTPVPWSNNRQPDIVPDPSRQSFLFSLSFNQKFTLQEPENATRHFLDRGPTFGKSFGLFDLYINDGCDKKWACHAYLGGSYRNPKYPQEERGSQFTGSSTPAFFTKEWEVWGLEFA